MSVFAQCCGPARLVAGLCVAILSGCATPRTSPPSVPAAAQAPAVIAYPARGQSDRRARQDRYECHLWAVQESGYDPATATASARPAPRVIAEPPPGTGTVTGAVAGAVIGAAVANPHHTGDGAAVGAVVGALAGAGADASRQARADAIQAEYDARAARSAATEDRRAEAYRRAISACLDARGYRVR
ncbi:glycine zipper 2TM domain-containing protein [Nitrogeniibacter mangrovi]|uniref:Glycine zipper 2TM domain-containing protein n=1 Tax=Nitrogeniibacter mangrovi TaxID=2016596 RepID=A0A6C1B2P5_9RHOO|nr:glycine zipper 2TM domain-containing protein [Nitrogeniibacter mangrovi]QID16620.1 glycine zipper 2TM domain-containing protein [Nitrogeniibacter mangrovi]